MTPGLPGHLHFSKVDMDSERQKNSEDDEKIIKSPIFVLVCSFIQIMAYYSTGEGTLLFLQYDPYRRQQIWRYLTPMLLHGSSYHLWDNVISQLILGTMLEMEHHSARITIIYIVGGLGGTMLTALVHSDEYVIGASTGVYAIVFAHVANMLINWNTMSWKRTRVLMPLLYALLSIGGNIYIGMQAVQRSPTYVHKYYSYSYFLVLNPWWFYCFVVLFRGGGSIPGNTEFAHVGNAGGAITGLLISGVLLKCFERHHWMTTVRRIAAGLLIIFFVVIIFINIFFPSHFPPVEYNEDYVEPYYNHVVKMVVKTEPNSPLREYCDNLEPCTEALKKLKASQ